MSEITFLVDDNASMDRRRRQAEQEIERRSARVHAREHEENEQKNGPEEAAENGMQEHPYLDSPRFDGVDSTVNPLPPLNSKARTEMENAQREQNLEKQLRLGNMPRFNSTPTPRGP